MNKTELIDILAADTGLPKAAVSTVLDRLDAITTGALHSGDEVVLPGLGKLKPVTRDARSGRNPQTGETLQIPSRVAVKFVASKALSHALQKG